MKSCAWQNQLAFPGLFPVLVWLVGCYIDLFPGAITGVIRLALPALLIGWIGWQLFWLRTDLLRTGCDLSVWLRAPHFYLLIYTIIALFSAAQRMNRISLLNAGYAVLFVLLAILLTYRFVNQPADRGMLYLQRLWQLILFACLLRLGLLLVMMVLSAEKTVNFVDLGWLTLARVQKTGFYGAMNGNTVAYLGALLLVVAAGRLGQLRWQQAQWHQWPYWLLAGFVAIISLLLGYSRTILLALLSVGIAYLILKRRVLWLILLSAILIVTATQFNPLVSYVIRGQNWADFVTFGGRVYAWRAAWQAFLAAPLVGYGYLDGELVALKAALIQYFPDQRHLEVSHNTFFSVLLGNGLLGFIPFGIAFALIGWRTTKQYQLLRQTGGSWCELAYELWATFLILAVSCLTLTNMLYVTTGFRNLPWLPLLIFSAMQPTITNSPSRRAD